MIDDHPDLEPGVADAIGELQQVIVKAMTGLDSQFDAKLQRLETRLDESEKIVAVLTQGYAEIAAIVESIFSTYINQNEEQKQEFFDTLKMARKTMMETLQHGTKIAETNSDRFVAHSTGVDEQPRGDSATSNEGLSDSS